MSANVWSRRDLNALQEGSVIRKYRITARDGKSSDIQHYYLDMINVLGKEAITKSRKP